MSQQTFFRMLFTPDGRQWSKLESFLGASILVKHFSRAVNEPVDPNNITVRPVPNEPDTYRIEHLSLQITFAFDNQSSIYRIHLASLFDPSLQQSTNVVWGQEELNIFETFLNDVLFPLSSVSNQIMMPSIDILTLGAMPNRNSAVGTLERFLSIIHPRVLRDLIKIIRLEQVSHRH